MSPLLSNYRRVFDYVSCTYTSCTYTRTYTPDNGARVFALYRCDYAQPTVLDCGMTHMFTVCYACMYMFNCKTQI